MPHPKVKLSDNLGNEVSVTNNKLDINVSYPTVAHGSMNVTGTAKYLYNDFFTVSGGPTTRGSF